jgi:hypothetical protein
MKSSHVVSFRVCYQVIIMAASLVESLAIDGKHFTETGDETSRQKIIATASALIQELENPGEQLARIGWGEPTRTAAFRTLFNLGILQKLGQEPQSSKQLAAGTKADPVLVGMYSFSLSCSWCCSD